MFFFLSQPDISSSVFPVPDDVGVCEKSLRDKGSQGPVDWGCSVNGDFLCEDDLESQMQPHRVDAPKDRQQASL